MAQGMLSEQRLKKGPWLAVFFVFSLIFLAAGYWYLRTDLKNIRQEKTADLDAILNLKISQVVQWRNERLSDAQNLAESPLFKKALQEWLTNPSNLDLEREILDRLRLTGRAYSYYNVLFFDEGGQILLSVKEESEPMEAATKRAMEESVARGKAILSDLYRSPSGNIYLDCLAPVFGQESKLLAVLALRNEAHAFLFPLIQSWPTLSNTAETILVRREGEEVVILNELRHRSRTSLSLRFPLSQTTLPSVQAISGKVSALEAKDYRGVKVLASLHPVPDSDWLMVAKVDASEILAEMHYHGAETTAIIILLILLGAAITSLGHRLQQTRLLRSLYQAEKRQRETQEEFRTTLYSIGDAVITTDRQGRVKMMNPVAEQLTGWSEAEAREKPLQEVFFIINEDNRAEAENPVQRVLREGIVVGLANHTVLIARDGREIPIADAGAPIRNESGEIIGVVLVFRDQTKDRQAQRAVQEAKEFAERIIATIREPLVVLDADMRVISANRAFYKTFQVSPEETEGRLIFNLGNRQWDIPQLRELLENILPQNTSFENFEVSHDFPHLGNRTMLLNARRIYREANKTQLILMAIEDITERKRAEEALRASEEKYRVIVENSHAGILIVGEDYKFSYVNKMLCQILGRNPEDILGHDFREFLDEESRGLVADRYIRRQRGEEVPSRYEFNIVRKDGEKRRVEISSAIVVDSRGKVKTVAQILDITERKRAEEALRKSEEKYRILHEFAGEAIFTYSRDLKLMEINKAACEYIGYKREELLGRNVFELGILHPDDQTLAIESMRKILSGEKSIVVEKLRFKGKHGLYGTFQVTATPVLRNGEIVAITNVCRDITNEERLYSALEASEKRYRFLFNAGNDAVFVYGLTEDKKPGNFIEVNELATTLTGYSKAELQKLTPIDLVEPGEREETYESNRIISEKKHRLFERTLVTKDGRLIPCEISSHFFELNGSPTVLAIARDITERKKTEENLKAALREKDVLLREIHHRVKNNMQIMASLLRLQARQVTDERALEAFKESQTRIRSMAMIHEKLYQSRDFTSIDFADYIEKMVTHLYVVYHVDPQRVRFKGDVRAEGLDINRAIPCGLIVNELVSNALKYAFPGEKRGELEVRMFKDEAGKYHLIVRDTGIGFPDNIDIHKAHTLGLQIVSDLTKQLEGKVEVRREGGTEFEITF